MITGRLEADSNPVVDPVQGRVSTPVLWATAQDIAVPNGPVRR